MSEETDKMVQISLPLWLGVRGWYRWLEGSRRWLWTALASNLVVVLTFKLD